MYFWGFWFQRTYMKMVRAEHPDVPCFLFGHSTGGALALKVRINVDGDECGTSRVDCGTNVMNYGTNVIDYRTNLMNCRTNIRYRSSLSLFYSFTLSLIRTMMMIGTVKSCLGPSVKSALPASNARTPKQSMPDPLLLYRYTCPPICTPHKP